MLTPELEHLLIYATIRRLCEVTREVTVLGDRAFSNPAHVLAGLRTMLKTDSDETRSDFLNWASTQLTIESLIPPPSLILGTPTTPAPAPAPLPPLPTPPPSSDTKIVVTGSDVRQTHTTVVSSATVFSATPATTANVARTTDAWTERGTGTGAEFTHEISLDIIPLRLSPPTLAPCPALPPTCIPAPGAHVLCKLLHPPGSIPAPRTPTPAAAWLRGLQTPIPRDVTRMDSIMSIERDSQLVSAMLAFIHTKLEQAYKTTFQKFFTEQLKLFMNIPITTATFSKKQDPAASKQRSSSDSVDNFRMLYRIYASAALPYGILGRNLTTTDIRIWMGDWNINKADMKFNVPSSSQTWEEGLVFCAQEWIKEWMRTRGDPREAVRRPVTVKWTDRAEGQRGFTPVPLPPGAVPTLLGSEWVSFPPSRMAFGWCPGDALRAHDSFHHH